MSKEQQQKIKKLIEQEQALRQRDHEEFEVQKIAADLLFIYLEIPRWKVWAWYPIVRRLVLMEKMHKNCCGFSLD